MSYTIEASACEVPKRRSVEVAMAWIENLQRRLEQAEADACAWEQRYYKAVGKSQIEERQ